MNDYPSIADHGLIGDLQTTALVATDGTMDWLCSPRLRITFEKMLTYANHLGLYSEEIALTGEQIGNFPQAFTHLALIDAAITLNDRLDASSAKRRRSR